MQSYDLLILKKNRKIYSQILTKVSRILHSNRYTDKVEHEPYTSIMSRVMALWFLAHLGLGPCGLMSWHCDVWRALYGVRCKLLLCDALARILTIGF